MESIDDLFAHLDSLLSQRYNRFELFDIQLSVSSGAKLIVYLENPNVDIKVVDNQARQGQLEFELLLNIVRTHRDRNVADLEDSLGSTLRRVDDVASLDVRFTTEDRSAHLDRKLDIIITDFAWHDVRVLSINQVLNLKQSFGRV